MLEILPTEETCTVRVRVTFNENEALGYRCESTQREKVQDSYFGLPLGMASAALFSKYTNEVGS